MRRARVRALIGLAMTVAAVVAPQASAARVELKPLAPAKEPKIYGGASADAGEWPFMAAIVLASQPDPSLGQFCGGTVIAPHAVLTAAHCVDAVNVDPTRMHVLVGQDDLAGSGGQRVAVRAVHRHPLAVTTGRIDHDAAILELSEPVSVPAIRLATAVDDAALNVPDAIAWAIGWGAITHAGVTDPKPVYPNELQEAPIPLLGDQSCASVYGSPPYDAASTTCAGWWTDGRSDVCSGDSGGPLMRQDAAGAWVQLGIVSFGAAIGCGMPGTPAAFGQVAAMADWAAGVIALTDPPPPPPPPPAPVAETAAPAPVAPAPVTPAPIEPAAVTTTPVNHAPKARAFAVRARRGTSFLLRYRVSDDSKRTREVVTVWSRGGRLKARIRTAFSASLPGHVYAVRWRIPARFPTGKLIWCVQAYDLQGKHDRACAYLRVR